MGESSGRAPALLMSGGIGDYLHYLIRLEDFLASRPDAVSELVVFVESTVPAQVARLFALAFPTLTFEFVPAAIHWTKTNPLLVPYNEAEQRQRPAYRYVRQLGFDITDWFLPFCCKDYRVDLTPLSRIVGDAPAAGSPTMVVSLRDKGFLWWPSVRLLSDIEAMVPSWNVIYYGTPVEALSGFHALTTATDVVEALATCYWADLFVGTDTGLATIRELSGRELIYCIDEYWLRDLMVRYEYIDLKRTRSQFAFSPTSLLDLLAKYTQLVAMPARSDHERPR